MPSKPKKKAMPTARFLFTSAALKNAGVSYIVVTAKPDALMGRAQGDESWIKVTPDPANPIALYRKPFHALVSGLTPQGLTARTLLARAKKLPTADKPKPKKAALERPWVRWACVVHGKKFDIVTQEPRDPGRTLKVLMTEIYRREGLDYKTTTLEDLKPFEIVRQDTEVVVLLPKR